MDGSGSSLSYVYPSQYLVSAHGVLQEGAITILLGFMGYVTIIDFPDKASNPSPITKRPFLTVQESTIILARIQRDRGDAVVDKLTWANIRHHLKDWKIWEFAWLYFLNNVVAYSWGYFLPIILRNDMGYSVSMSQIMSFPPYVLAAAWMFATAWVADRYRKRGLIIIFNCSWAVIGVCMMAFVKNPQARYAGGTSSAAFLEVFTSVLSSSSFSRCIRRECKRTELAQLHAQQHRRPNEEKYRECAIDWWWRMRRYCRVQYIQTTGCSEIHVSFSGDKTLS